MKTWILMLLAFGCSERGAQTPADGSQPDGPQSPRTALVWMEEDHTTSRVESDTYVEIETEVGYGRQDGPCRIEVYGQGPYTAFSAGPVTLDWGGSESLVFPFQNGCCYLEDMFQGARYAPDDMISISAPGGTAPPISGTVTFPSAVVVTSPATTVSTISKSGFTATWVPTTGTVVIRVVQSDDQSTSVSCSFDAASGTGTIPATALADLLVTAGPGLSMGGTSRIAISSENDVNTNGYTLSAVDTSFTSYNVGVSL
jgi:hypothetical protein